MRYYIAADGGGSKLHAILYDDTFRVHRSLRTVGVNTVFKPEDVVRDNIVSLLNHLTEDLDGPVEAADICLVGARELGLDIFSQHPLIKEVVSRSEPVVGMAAALKDQGVLSLSGTGSDTFFIMGGQTLDYVGGWGPLLGDEGSGYDIGLNAIKAAIYSHDGRKAPTMLYDLIMDAWKLESLWDVVHRLANNPDARHEIASVAVLCAKAAALGDPAAIRIYEHAALEMSRQAATVIERAGNDWDGSVTIMGGAWKGYPRMFDIFKQEITLRYPSAVVTKPYFEPVVGCAVLRFQENGYRLDELLTPMQEGFAALRYPQ